jgi:pimeloyl-ACP methyl ester carboxylesterase
VADAEVAQALAALAHRASDRMPELESDPALTRAADDQEWLNALATRLEEDAPEWRDEIDGVEAFGSSVVWDRLSEAVIRVRGAAGRLGGGAAARLLRADIHRQAALFLGDVFFYLDRRGDRDHPGPIVDQVVQTLESAIDAGTPLVVVAHSMGGEIVYDVLSYYRRDIRVQMLVTVGSQVGLFEELCLLQAGKQAGCPDGPTRVSKLDNVGEWINVFDRNDLFGFAAERIFEGAKDFHYSTGKGLFAAHSSYFTMPSFYRRLAERLKVRE